jgi:hypothetical protein
VKNYSPDERGICWILCFMIIVVAGTAIAGAMRSHSPAPLLLGAVSYLPFVTSFWLLHWCAKWRTSAQLAVKVSAGLASSMAEHARIHRPAGAVDISEALRVGAHCNGCDGRQCMDIG